MKNAEVERGNRKLAGGLSRHSNLPFERKNLNLSAVMETNKGINRPITHSLRMRLVVARLAGRFLQTMDFFSSRSGSGEMDGSMENDQAENSENARRSLLSLGMPVFQVGGLCIHPDQESQLNSWHFRQ